MGGFSNQELTIGNKNSVFGCFKNGDRPYIFLIFSCFVDLTGFLSDKEMMSAT